MIKQRFITLWLLIFMVAILVTPTTLAVSSYVAPLQSLYGAGLSCGTCHINPGGGGSRNAYGTLFENQPNHAADPAAALQVIGPPPGVSTPVPTSPTHVPTSGPTPPVPTSGPPVPQLGNSTGGPAVNCYVVKSDGTISIGTISIGTISIGTTGTTTGFGTVGTGTGTTSGQVPTSAELLAKIQPLLVPANRINPNTPLYTSYGTGTVYLYKLPNTNPTVLVAQTSGAIDCDGQVTTQCNTNTDPAFQSDTSFHQSNGAALDAATLPYYVLPVVGPYFDYTQNGIQGGQLGTILYGNGMNYGVFGDESAINNHIGEISYAMANSLGIDSNPATGGVQSGVTFIIFTGAGDVVSPIESRSQTVAMGDSEMATLWTQLGGTITPPVSTASGGPTPAPSGTLMLEDHFQGTTLNTNIWNHLYTGPGWLPSGNAGSYYRTENIIVNNGLHLLINRESYSGYSYTGGGLSTDIGITSGRVEVRARFPQSNQGIVGYLLLWPVDGSWPPELDFAETTGKDANTITFTQHWGTSSNSQAQTDKYNIDVTQWHIYTLDIINGELKWYVDGNLINTQKQNFNTIKVKFAAGVWAGACDGSYGGCPSTAALPQYLDIDYVKLYQG